MRYYVLLLLEEMREEISETPRHLTYCTPSTGTHVLMSFEGRVCPQWSLQSNHLENLIRN